MVNDVSLRHSQEPDTLTFLSQINSIQAQTHFLIIHFNIFPHQCLGIPEGIFPSGPPTKTLYISLLPTVCATCSNYLIFIDLVNWITFSKHYGPQIFSQTNTYRWSFLSVLYHKLHARTRSTVLQAAHCHWRCPHNLWILLLTVAKFVDLFCLLSVRV